MAASPKPVPQFAPFKRACLELPANGGNFANEKKIIENHRRIVAHRRVGQALPLPTCTRVFIRAHR